MSASPARGHLYAVLAVVLFSTEAACARAIGPDINVAQVALLRAIMQGAFLYVWMRGSLRGVVTSPRRGLLLGRGMLSASATLGYFYVFAHLPFATATVLFFVGVLTTTMAAGPVLGEHVGWRRWTATLVGFAGVVIVVRPGSVALDSAVIVALLLALNSAALNMATKDLARTETPATIMAWIGFVTFSVSLPWAILTWSPIDLRTFVLMFVIGGVATYGQYLTIRSYQLADASAVAPIVYLRIVFAVAIGYFIFGETLDGPAILGSLIVTGAALYITLREATLARRRRSTD